MMYSGDKLSDIPDKQYLTIETEHAAEIIRGLDLSGIAYFAKAEENVIYLTFSADCKVVVDEIVAKAESGDYEELMLQLSENGSDGYAPLYAEIAEILHCAVGSVTSRPPEITDILAKTYINYWHSDRQTIQRALERIIDLNAETENELAVMERTDIHRKEMPDKEHLQMTQAVSDGEADRRRIAEGIIVEENRSVYLSAEARRRIMEEKRKHSSEQKHMEEREHEITRERKNYT